jgi:hypothetical protein
MFHSSLCQVTWTEVVHGTQRFAFEQRKPLELRFGLRIKRSFWSSFDSSSFFINFHIFRRGFFHSKDQAGNITELPGRGSEELWLGMSFGMAEQVSRGTSGLYSFRPQIWFQRFGPSGYIPGEFAVAEEDHWFAVELGSPPDGSEQGFERFVGGRGRP